MIFVCKDEKNNWFHVMHFIISICGTSSVLMTLKGFAPDVDVPLVIMTILSSEHLH